MHQRNRSYAFGMSSKHQSTLTTRNNIAHQIEFGNSRNLGIYQHGSFQSGSKGQRGNNYSVNLDSPIQLRLTNQKQNSLDKSYQGLAELNQTPTAYQNTMKNILGSRNTLNNSFISNHYNNTNTQLNRQAYQLLKQQKHQLFLDRQQALNQILKQNESQLDKVPDTIANPHLKDQFIKVRKNVMSRIISNEIYDKTLSEWKLPKLRKMATKRMQEEEQKEKERQKESRSKKERQQLGREQIDRSRINSEDIDFDINDEENREND
eukprot:403374615